MTIYEFINEYENLTEARRKDFFRRLFGEIVENLDNETIQDFVNLELLPVFLEAENDDMFGTEGFRG